MYERMLNKQILPSFDDLISYCGKCGTLWEELDNWIKKEYDAKTQIRFPYGKNYGWSIKYSKSSKHICDIFAENEAFTVFLKLSCEAFELIKSNLSEYSKEIYANKYPCGDGGWIRYRITDSKHTDDAKRFINAKVNP